MHLDYPYSLDARGRTSETTDEDWVRDLVEQVLFTAPGERVNRPTFGSGVMRLVFEPGGDELATPNQVLVQGALTQLLGESVGVQAGAVTSHDSTLQVAVRFRSRTSSQPQTAVFSRPV